MITDLIFDFCGTLVGGAVVRRVADRVTKEHHMEPTAS
jgi:hypothetical protein